MYKYHQHSCNYNQFWVHVHVSPTQLQLQSAEQAQTLSTQLQLQSVIVTSSMIVSVIVALLEPVEPWPEMVIFIGSWLEITQIPAPNPKTKYLENIEEEKILIYQLM